MGWQKISDSSKEPRTDDQLTKKKKKKGSHRLPYAEGDTEDDVEASMDVFGVH